MAHKHPIYDTDKHFVIDPITKKISTESPKLVLAQHSHNSERVTFEIPKEVEGHDMSLCNAVEIHYMNVEAANKSNKSADIYEVTDLQTGTDGTEDVVFGSWLIDGNVTKYVGGLTFAICFSCIADDGTVDYSWPTLLYSSISVGETVWNTKIIASEYSDVIAQFGARIAALEKNGGGGGTVKTVNNTAPDENGNVEIEIPEVDLSGYAKTEDIPTIPKNIVQTVNGVTPDENGNVTIDSGGNVKNGEDGFSPIATVEQTDTGAVISITDVNGTTTATVTNGKDGVDGEDGKTPARGVDYWTEADKTEIKSYVDEAILGGAW